MLVTSISFSTLLVLAALTSAAPASKSIWSISIFRDPAPSPEDGPPASANALRDSSKLKFEVVGIVCAYLAWIIVTVTAVIVIGRRLRKNQEKEHIRSQSMELFKSGRVTLREIDAGPKSPLGPLSPKSPGKMSSIRSWTKGNRGRTSEVSIDTTASRIDERVVENDKARNMDEMANLYAAVMIHDQTRATSKSLSSADSSPILDENTPASPRSPRTPRTPRSPQYPPEFAHPAYVPPVPQAYPQSYPLSYPQEYSQPVYEPMPQAIPETDEDSLLDGQTPRKPKKSLSIVSAATSRLGSSHSSRPKPAPITVRGQLISKPLGSADLRQSAYNTSQTSLPSVYSPGPPPPTPGRHAPVEEIEMHGVPQITPSQDSFQNGSKALPFRQFYQSDALKSAPATKTTFLDRRASAFNGPKTGVPKTPYSPYCPQTPMTPITPRRLLNKEELKKNKKQYALQKVEENSLVKNDDDMWGT